VDAHGSPSGESLKTMTLDTTPAGTSEITNDGGDITIFRASLVLEVSCAVYMTAIEVNGFHLK